MLFDLLEAGTNRVTAACEDWIAGEGGEQRVESCFSALNSIVSALKPVHEYLDVEQAKLEEQAFAHTAELVVIAARYSTKTTGDSDAQVQFAWGEVDSKAPWVSCHYVEII